MSIINDALKKLQNQISHSTPQASDLNSNIAQVELTPAQKAGFQPIEKQPLTHEISEPQKQTAAQPMESHLVIILGILCLLIGLFVPIINKQSVLVLMINKATDQVKQFQQARNTPPAKPVEPIKTRQPAAKVTPPIAAPSPEKKTTQTIVKNTPSQAVTVKKSVKPQSRIIINGIMNNGVKNLALVDGQIYEEGDEVEGVKLLKITPKGVTVLEEGEERTIKVMGL